MYVLFIQKHQKNYLMGKLSEDLNNYSNELGLSRISEVGRAPLYYWLSTQLIPLLKLFLKSTKEIVAYFGEEPYYRGHYIIAGIGLNIKDMVTYDTDESSSYEEFLDKLKRH